MKVTERVLVMLAERGFEEVTNGHQRIWARVNDDDGHTCGRFISQYELFHTPRHMLLALLDFKEQKLREVQSGE